MTSFSKERNNILTHVEAIVSPVAPLASCSVKGELWEVSAPLPKRKPG